MAKGKKSIRQIRAVELDKIRKDVETVGETIVDMRAVSRLVAATPRLLDEVERLKGEVANRDERLAKIGAATKRPVNKRGPRKPKEAATDPAQTSIPGSEPVPAEPFMSP
jgi:hypothetical protein